MTSSSAKPKPQVILCIDDDNVALRVRRLLLGSAGYEVLVATSGETGLEVFKQNAVDLVIADHFLTAKTGTEVAREMKALKPNVPILIVSGAADEPCGIEFAEGFLSKGEAPEVLLDTISGLLKS